jgi:hypothetical protein
MSKKNIYWVIAGCIALFTSFLHLIGGQVSIVNPMMESSMPLQPRSEMLAAWHIVTVFLFLSSYYLLRSGFGRYQKSPEYLIQMISYAYLAFGIVFIIVSLLQTVFAPQWILLMPVGVFGILGQKKLISKN